MRTWLRERLWYRLLGRLTRFRQALRNVRRGHGISKKAADDLFPDANKCVHCGGWHQHSCPRIKVIDFAGDTPSHVEFWPWWNDKGKPGWPHDQVVFPWQKAAMIDTNLLEGEVIP